jgi:predicted dehydrogenase
VGVIGAGNYARSVLLPALARTKANLAAVADINGVVAAHAARKFGAGKAVSNHLLILEDPGIHAVFVVVGHHLHARFVCEALKAGKHVFVEKPLALNEAELTWVEEAAARVSDRLLMVGFNRRFSPHIVKIKELLEGRTEPLCMTMTVNAGFILPEHWVQDPQRGGGRIIGEGCHFIDLLSHLAGNPVTTVSAMMVGGNGPIREDKMSILLSFADGSVGTVHYFANGSKNYPKETLEIFGDGRVIRMENFRITKGYGFKGFRSFRTWRQDKGHRAEIAAFVDRVASGGVPLIPIDQLANVTRASFAAVESAKSDRTIQL